MRGGVASKMATEDPFRRRKIRSFTLQEAVLIKFNRRRRGQIDQRFAGGLPEGAGGGHIRFRFGKIDTKREVRPQHQFDIFQRTSE